MTSVETQEEKIHVKVYFCDRGDVRRAGGDREGDQRACAASSRPTGSSSATTSSRRRRRSTGCAKRTPDLVANLPSNPLPDAFEIGPRTGENVKAISAALRTPAKPPGVEKMRDGGEIVRPRREGRASVSTAFAIATDPAPDLVGAPDREHDPALDLLASPRDRGDEARRRDELVRARPVHARGADLRDRSARCCAILLLLVARSSCCRRSSAASTAPRTSRRGRSAGSRRSSSCVGLTVGAIGSGLTLRRFLNV